MSSENGPIEVAVSVAKGRTLAWLLGIMVPIVLPMLAVLALALVVAGFFSSPATTSSSWAATPAAQKLIPPDLLVFYQSDVVKKQCPTLSWSVVAAIVTLESGNGQNSATSSAGAVGPGQFLPSTWAQYGVDGDGDGIKDIMDIHDVAPSIANLLCRNGGGDPSTLPQAIYAYNHAWWYVFGGLTPNGQSFEGVLPLAQRLAVSASSDPRVQDAVQLALSAIGTPYVWGGQSETGGFDCSGLVWWAFSQAGFNFSRTTAAGEYDWGVHVPLDQLQPGDLVFWAYDVADPATIHHVAIYLGDGQIVAAPHSGDVVKKEDLYDLSHIIGGTRVVDQKAEKP